MNKKYDYLENKEEENKLTQAFLIGNTNYFEIKDELLNVINKFIFKSDINITNTKGQLLLNSTIENNFKKFLKKYWQFC